MPEDNLEKLVVYAYRRWKIKFSKEENTVCPSEEALSCFKDGILPKKEEDKVRLHLLFCDRCSENVILDAKIQSIDKEIPQELMQLVKDQFGQIEDSDVLEVILALKEKFLEVVRATADFLEDKDENSQPVLLRGPRQGNICEEVQLVKYFGRIKVNLKIQKEEERKVKVNVIISEKKTGRPGEGLRVSLKKDGEAIESYIVKQGAAIFTGVPCGRYEIEISDMRRNAGRVVLELR